MTKEKTVVSSNIKIKGKETVLHFKDAISAYEHFCSQEDSLGFELQAMPHKFLAFSMMNRFADLGVPPKAAAKYTGEMVDFMHYICDKVASGEVTVYNRNVNKVN